MRKVICHIHVSLDGFASGTNGELDWLIPHALSEEAYQDQYDMLRTIDTVLLGRSNYEGFFGYWPAVATNPSSREQDIEFSQWLNDIPKIVFSTKLEKVEWKNASLVKENIVEEITRLKQQPGKNMLIMNSTGLAQSFMRLGLIDEYRIKVLPVILGGGNPFFSELKNRINLQHVDTKLFSSGAVGLTYQSVDET